MALSDVIEPLVGDHSVELHAIEPLVGDHWVELDAIEPLVGDHWVELDVIEPLVGDHWVELDVIEPPPPPPPPPPVGDHWVEIETVEEFAAPVASYQLLGDHLVKFEPSFELVGDNWAFQSIESPDELLGDHCTEFEPLDEVLGDYCTTFEDPDELLGDHCTKFEPPGRVLIDHWVRLQTHDELVGEHRLGFVEFEALVDHLLGPSDSLSGEDLETLPGSFLVARENWMALDSPHLEHHNSWMKVLDGHPAGYEDLSGNLKFKTKNANCHDCQKSTNFNMIATYLYQGST